MLLSLIGGFLFGKEGLPSNAACSLMSGCGLGRIGLLIKSESVLGFNFGVRAQTERYDALKALYCISLIRRRGYYFFGFLFYGATIQG